MNFEILNPKVLHEKLNSAANKSLGSSAKKRELIRRNDYLWRCFDRLASEKDKILFIYGCSIINEDNLKINNDEHIWRAVMNSHISEICISIHENLESNSSEPQQKRLNDITDALLALVDSEEKKQNKQIYFYSSIDSNIWEFSD
jgi:hypothetical protein